MTNPAGYALSGSTAKTYDNWGTPTGLVQLNGSSSSDSRINKRYEDSAGVVFNVRDGFVTSNNLPVYFIHAGTITLWIKTLAGRYNKIFTDFNHNYKYY